MCETTFTITSAEQLYHLDKLQVVILDADIGPLNREQEQALCAFVERGGGLICLGEAIQTYHEYTLLGEVMGCVRGFCTPACEIIANIAHADHYITRRVEPTMTIYEAIYLIAEIKSEATILWSTIWQFKSYALAYTRTHGDGRVFCTVLGSTLETRNQPVFKQMVERALRYTAEVQEVQERSLRVAMIGYGAIGLEHGTAIENVPGLEYALVCDRNEERLKLALQSFPTISTCTDLAQVADDPDIDVVIVSTPPDTHAAVTMQMLRAGKHVVTEKPFCLTTQEADAMIQLASEQKRALTVYQCRRWDPDYLAIQRVLQQNTIGAIFHLETFIGGYAHPCNYWHSHEAISGGIFYDWGSHYLDWILNMIPDRVVSVRGIEHKRVWHTVTNADQASIYLSFAGGQQAEFTHSDIAMAVKPKWYILGEQGAIVGEWRQETIKSRRWSGDLIEQRLALSEAQPDLFVYTRERDGSVHRQQLGLPQPPAYIFHRNLANHLHNGEPLAVTPQQARRNIIVMEAAKRSAALSGVSIPISE